MNNLKSPLEFFICILANKHWKLKVDTNTERDTRTNNDNKIDMLIIRMHTIVSLVISLLKAMLLAPKANNYFFFSSLNDQDLVSQTSLNESSKQLFSLAISVIFCGLHIITCAGKGNGSCEQRFSPMTSSRSWEKGFPQRQSLKAGPGCICIY